MLWLYLFSVEILFFMRVFFCYFDQELRKKSTAREKKVAIPGEGNGGGRVGLLDWIRVAGTQA